MVIILAAGKGTRMSFNNPRDHKCAISLPADRYGRIQSSVSRLIQQFYQLGESNFIVVVGHEKEAVIANTKTYGCNVSFVVNDKYDTRGCEYSLAKGSLFANFKSEDLYVVEGDIVINNYDLKNFYSYLGNCVLVRDSSFLTERSVAAVYCRDRVVNFMYDPRHQFNMQELSKLNSKVFDSAQVWKFKSGEVVDLLEKLQHYLTKADDEGSPSEILNASGIYTINSYIIDHLMRAVRMTRQDCWVNLNTQEDIEKLKLADWY